MLIAFLTFGAIFVFFAIGLVTHTFVVYAFEASLAVELLEALYGFALGFNASATSARAKPTSAFTVFVTNPSLDITTVAADNG